MAEVYQGFDSRLHRPVAIKIMSAVYSNDPTFIKRFELEARSAAGIVHPGVVSIYDHGQDRGVTYLVMELVVGATLRDLLRERGPFQSLRAWLS